MAISTIDLVWRDYVTDGVPSTGANKPDKGDIRDTLNSKFDDLDDAVAAAAAGIKWKTPVRVATTANGTLATAFDNASVVDGVTLATSDRILIKDQSAPAENGVYVVAASGAPTRATDADTGAEILSLGVLVTEGTDNTNTQWVCTTPATITPGSTALTFIKVKDDDAAVAAEVTEARGPLTDLWFSILSAQSTVMSELGDTIFDPMTPVFRSGRVDSEANITTAIGQAQPFTWDGTRFDYVKMHIRCVAGDAVIRVGIWSADKATLYASGYAVSLRIPASAGYNHLWIRLDRPIDTAVVAAGVLYFSVDGIKSDTALNGRIAGWEVNERNTPSLVTYPLLYNAYTSPTQDLASWIAWTDTGSTGLVFELFNSRSTSKRGATPSNPRPEEIVMTPRLCGIVGTEMNVYLKSLVAGRRDRMFRATGIVSPARQLSERWTMTPSAAVVGGTLTLKSVDPDDPLGALDTLTATVDVVAANAAAAAVRVICCMGDSLTAGGQYIQRNIDKATANVNGVQPTFQGTKGTGAVKHEGVGGRRLTHFYQPTTVPIAADNPFVTGVNQYFDATYYMSNNPTFVTPDIVVWAGIGPNEAISQHSTSETVMHAVATQYCDELAEMIGVQASANPIVPWSDVDPDMTHIVGLPTASGTQDGFGVITYAGLNYHEAIAHRYLHILRQRIIKTFGNSEGDNIFLMPWHVASDPINAFAFTSTTYNVNTARTVDRADDGIHPNAVALGGYEQMGDALWAMLNVGVAKGWF